MADVELSLLYSNTWNNLTVCKQMINSKQNYSFLDRNIEPTQLQGTEWVQAPLKISSTKCVYKSYLIYIYV